MNFSDSEFKKDGVENLKLAKKILNELGVFFFLSNGTLLGAIRDDDFIAHDTDIDLGIKIETLSVSTDLILNKFLENGFERYGVFGTVENGLELSLKRGQVKLDLFFYYDDGDTSTMSVQQGDRSKKYVFPKIDSWGTMEFLGDTYYIPANFIDYLEAEYGGDWQTPVVEWDYWTSPHNLKNE